VICTLFLILTTKKKKKEREFQKTQRTGFETSRGTRNPKNSKRQGEAILEEED